MNRKDLVDFLIKEVEAFPGKVSLLMVDMRRGKDLLTHDADAQVSSASTIKVPIMMTALDQVVSGKLTLNQMVPVTDICEDTHVFEAENLRPEYPLVELLEWMIVLSDNTATNAVIDLLGMDAVNEFCARVGTKSTILQRKMLDFESLKAGRNNLTSARDQYMFFSLLCWLAERSEIWAQGLEILKRQRCKDSFLRYIPAACPVAHKTGGLDYVNHDCGVFLDQADPFYLGIFTWDGPALDGENFQQRFIGKLTKAIYDSHMEGSI